MRKPRRVAVMLELDSPFKRHTDVFAGVQQYAQERGWHLVVDEFADAKPTTDQPPYDGVVARATRKLAERARREGLVVVNVWFNSPVRQRLPGVFPDYAAIGRLRAEHLVERGFGRFAVLTTEADRAHERELAGFVETLADSGHDCTTERVVANPQRSLGLWRESERKIANWLETWQPPIGVYVGVDSLARVVAQMCQNRGWRVPEDVAIVAGWNEQPYCEGLRPTLSSVEVGFARIGHEAARLLDGLMEGEPPPAGPILLPPTGLVVRESTDFFAVEDPLMQSALEYIAANSARAIGPADVAESVHVSTRTLQRRFNEHLQRSVAAEIRRVRIERAKRELAQTKRPIAQIARTAGFGEPMRMYEVFRRELGVSPSEYRRNVGNA